MRRRQQQAQRRKNGTSSSDAAMQCFVRVHRRSSLRDDCFARLWRQVLLLRGVRRRLCRRWRRRRRKDVVLDRRQDRVDALKRRIPQPDLVRRRPFARRNEEAGGVHDEQHIFEVLRHGLVLSRQ